ncbi:MAG: hypothetical protein ACN4EF_05175 [Wenyingzhuangia sp.]|jgi:hypothetical protein|uniref:hypothetical protein n=1 Tax=Wenyingzhuangia sp. TaxID=1964193 RepID=UPI00321B5577
MKWITTFLFLSVFYTTFAIEINTDKLNLPSQKSTRIANSKKLENPFEEKQSISNQFEYLHKKSSIFKKYRLVNISLYHALKKSVLDTLANKENRIREKNMTIDHNMLRINLLEQKLSDTQNLLEDSKKQNGKRLLFGFQTTKNIFSLIITTTFIVLFVLLIFFILKHQQNLSVTKKSVDDLFLLELEFEKHKKSSFKRFQEVNRKLQDELNKKWKTEK